METSGECPWAAQFLAESIPHMVCVACADGSLEYFNQRTLDYTGLAAEEPAAHRAHVNAFGAGNPGKGTTVVVRIPIQGSTDENSDC